MIKFNEIDEPTLVELEKIEYGDMFAMKIGDGFEHIYLKFEQATINAYEYAFRCFDLNQRTMEKIYPDKRVRPLDVTISYSYAHD